MATTPGRPRIGIRWWLATAFALVAATTAAVAIAVVSQRTSQGFRENAETLVLGNAVRVAERVKPLPRGKGLTDAAQRSASAAQLTVFVFDAQGHAIAAGGAAREPLTRVPDATDAVATAVGGDRYIASNSATGEIVAALPVHGRDVAAVLVTSQHTNLRTQLGVVHDSVWLSALLGTLVGAAVGLVIATMLAYRLKRIARAARSIEAGDFSTPVEARFPDEISSLAASVDSMRRHLRDLFTRLRDDRDRLEQLLDRLNHGVALVEADLTVSYANAAAAEMLGRLPLLGLPLPDLVGRDATLRSAVESPDADEVTRLELPDGRVLLAATVPPRAGEPLILLLADETARERADRAQRDFAANASHQLRTPLAAIISSVEMLQTGAKDDPVARDAFLAAIEEHAGRLARLTQGLLTLARSDARQESPHLTRVPVEGLLDRVAAAAPRRGPSVIVAAQALDAWCDEALLEQALVAVTENAVRHAATSVVLSTRDAPAGKVTILVEDDGPGIPPEARLHLFDRFYGGAEDGFGLGLAIARQALAAIGGTISVESDECGTTFTLTVPAYARAAVT